MFATSAEKATKSRDCEERAEHNKYTFKNNVEMNTKKEMRSEFLQQHFWSMSLDLLPLPS